MPRLNKQLLRLGILLVLGLFLFVRWTALTTPLPRGKTEKRGEPSGWRREFSQSDLDLLARAVYAEAEGEPYDGQIAVAAVILNRVRHPEFPNTVPGVIYEPLAFSTVTNGRIYKQPDSKARQAAHDALNGIDPSGGALYFYNPGQARGAWVKSRPVLKTIGKHVFSG